MLGLVSPAVGDNPLLVSVAGDVPLEFLQSLWPGPVVRMMPTVTSAVGRGVTLLCGDPEDTARVRGVLPHNLSFLEVPEARWNGVATVTSCGPGLVSALLKGWCDALTTQTGLGAQEVEALVAETVTAALALRERNDLTFEAILKAVASPGGVTGEGARVLGARMPGVWSEASSAMEARHRDREESVRRSFAEQSFLP